MIIVPQDIHDALYSERTMSSLEEIWIAYKLDTEQQLELSNELGLYMTGQTKKDRFIPNLMYRLDINKSSAEAIANEIDIEIISLIQNSFNQLQEESPDTQSTAIPSQNRSSQEFSNDIIPGMGIGEIPITSKSEDASPLPQKEEPHLSKKEVLEEVEYAGEAKPIEKDFDEYNNYSPLNVIKDNVLNEIENPLQENERSHESNEGTALDSKLDQILKKPRVIETPGNLPTEPEEKQPNFQTENGPVVKTPHRKVPNTPYIQNQDPYREPIE